MKTLIVLLLFFVCYVYCDERNQTFLEKNKKYFEGAEYIGTSFKELAGVPDAKAFNIKFLAKLAKKIGPMFGIIGAAFSIFAALIPKGPSKELLALQRNFKMMHVMFDGLERRLDKMMIAIETNAVYNQYAKTQERLRPMLLKHRQYVDNPNSTRAASEMHEVCRYAAAGSADVLDEIHQKVAIKGGSIGLELSQAILKGTAHDLTKVIEISRIIFADANQASFMRHICLGLKSNNATDIEVNSVNKTDVQLNEITQALGDMVEQLKRDFPTSMEKDVLEKIGKPGQEIPNAQEIKKFLLGKYHWLDIGLVLWKASGDLNLPPGFQQITLNGTNALRVVVPGYYSAVINWVRKESGDFWRRLSDTSIPYKSYCDVIDTGGETPFVDLVKQLRQKFLKSDSQMSFVLYGAVNKPEIMEYGVNTMLARFCGYHIMYLGY